MAGEINIGGSRFKTPGSARPSLPFKKTLSWGYQFSQVAGGAGFMFTQNFTGIVGLAFTLTKVYGAGYALTPGLVVLPASLIVVNVGTITSRGILKSPPFSNSTLNLWTDNFNHRFTSFQGYVSEDVNIPFQPNAGTLSFSVAVYIQAGFAAGDTQEMTCYFDYVLE